MEKYTNIDLQPYGLRMSERGNYVQTEPVFSHIRNLERIGWSHGRIALMAGLTESFVRQVFRRRAPRMKVRTAIAIMQIPLEPFLWKNEQHGTNQTYQVRGCRCDPCRKAHSDYQKARRYRVNVATRMVPAEPVRRRVQAAIDAGLTTKEKVHRAIGGSGRTVTMLMAGRYSMMRQPTVKRIEAYLAERYERARPRPVALPPVLNPVLNPKPKIQQFRTERQRNDRMVGKLVCKVCDRPIVDHKITEFCGR